MSHNMFHIQKKYNACTVYKHIQLAVSYIHHPQWKLRGTGELLPLVHVLEYRQHVKGFHDSKKKKILHVHV